MQLLFTYFFCLQVCLKIHALLKNGTFGKCPEHLANFEAKCRKLYPIATAFKLIEEDSLPTTNTMENHLDCQNETEKPAEDQATSQTENSPTTKPQEQLEQTEAVTDNVENN